MPNLTARQMLAQVPVRMAEGGLAQPQDWSAGMSIGRQSAIAAGQEDFWLQDVAKSANEWLANPRTAAEGYDAMIRSGIGVQDLLDAGISQDVISQALTAPVDPQQRAVNQLTLQGFTSNLMNNPNVAELIRMDPEAFYRQAQQFVTTAQKDGITPEERQQMQYIASQQGWGFADIRAAGVDPNILFGEAPSAVPAMPGTPGAPPTFPQTQPAYTPPQVYQPLPAQPDIYAPGVAALDEEFRASAPRTEIPGMPGQFDYTPAAKLKPATGAGYSWTPPSVTSRPRSLLSPLAIQGYGGLTSASQRFAQNRAQVNSMLRNRLQGNPALQNSSVYNQLRNRLVSGDFGNIYDADGNIRGDLFDPNSDVGSRLNQAISGLESQRAPFMQTQGFAPNFQSADNPYAGVTQAGNVGGFGGPITPVDLRYGALPFRDGGHVKKPDGSAKDMLARFANGGEVDVPLEELLRRQLEGIDSAETYRAPDQDAQTESQSMLERLNQAFYKNVSQPAVGTAIDMTLGLGDLAQMGGRYLKERAGFEPGEFTSVADPAKRALGVEDYDPYTVGGFGAAVLPFAGPARGEQVVRAAGDAAGALRSIFPNLGRETAAYTGAELAGAAAQEVMPDSMLAQIGASVAGGMGAGMGASAVFDPMRRIDGPRRPGEDADALTALDQPAPGSAAAMLDEVGGSELVVANPDAKGHALPPLLLVEGTGEKAPNPVTQQFTPQNKAKNFENIDLVESQNPNALMSRDNWMRAEEQAFGGDYLPAPPETAIRYAQEPARLAATLDRLSPDMRRSVDEGFSYVSEIKNLYNSRIAPPDMTGRLFLWGILSRGAGPAQQEGAFLDLLSASGPFIKKAVDGNFTDVDLSAWNDLAARSIPEGSPGRSVIMNANAAGRLMYALGQVPEGGAGSVLSRLHNTLSDPNKTGQQFRREFFELTQSPGIDNKVVSFIGLVSGKDDLLVMDRIQSRHLWDDGRYGGKNIYDGINNGGLSGILGGPRGLMVTEMLENGMSDSVQRAYAMVGRPEDASIGRMHWETWLISSNQPVSHSTLQAVRSGEAIGQAVTEGKRNTFSSGMTYRQAINGPIVEYPLSDGSIVRMTPERQKEFEAFIKDPKNGIVPRKFKVSESTDIPWFEQPTVNRGALDDAARQFENANPDGSLRSGDARNIEGGRSVSERRAEFLNNFRADQQRLYTARRNASGDSGGDLGETPGPYRSGSLAGNEGYGLLVFNPDPSALTSYQSAGMSLPAIRQVDAASDAVSYNADMTAAMSGHPFGAQVEIKSPEDLAQARLFRTDNGSGFAIKPDGDVVAVFASPGEAQGSAYAMLQAAVQAGGKKLDAFDTYLPSIYERVGFRPVARLPWNDDYAPPGWSKETFAKYNNGEPDVVFFVHDPEYFGGARNVPIVNEYDQAVALQDQALAQLSAAPASSRSTRPVNEQLGIDRAKSMVEESGYRWDDVKQITSDDEYLQFQRQYGIPSAVSELDRPTDVFNRGGALFFDEDTGAPVAYATSSASRAKPPEGFAKGGSVTSSRRMLENLIGKKPEGRRVDATGPQRFASPVNKTQ